MGSVAAYLWFYNSPLFLQFAAWVSANMVSYLLFILFFKVLGIIWPPVPGSIFTLGSIPFIGWQNAYLVDFVGSLIGSVCAYYLGKRYGIRLLGLIFDESTLKRISKVKIKKNKEFEGLFLMRLLGGSVVEVVVYAAGILKVDFGKFILASTLSHPIVGIPTYYFANNLLTGENLVLTFLSLIVFIVLVTKFKSRYFE